MHLPDNRSQLMSCQCCKIDLKFAVIGIVRKKISRKSLTSSRFHVQGAPITSIVCCRNSFTVSAVVANAPDKNARFSETAGGRQLRKSLCFLCIFCRVTSLKGNSDSATVFFLSAFQIFNIASGDFAATFRKKRQQTTLPQFVLQRLCGSEVGVAFRF